MKDRPLPGDPTPPAALLEIEDAPDCGIVMSSGVEPAAGVVRFSATIFGTVGTVQNTERGTSGWEVFCQSWVKEPGTSWGPLSGSGVLCSEPPQGCSPMTHVSGGQEYETWSGAEVSIFGFAASLGSANEGVLIVEGSEELRFRAFGNAGFLCLPVVLPVLPDGMCPSIRVEPNETTGVVAFVVEIERDKR